MEFHPQIPVQQRDGAPVRSCHFTLLVVAAERPAATVHRHPICIANTDSAVTHSFADQSLQLNIKLLFGRLLELRVMQSNSLVVEQSELLPSGDADSRSNSSSKGAPPVQDENDKPSVKTSCICLCIHAFATIHV